MSPPHPATGDDALVAFEHDHITIDQDVSGDVLTIRVAGAIDAGTCPDLVTALKSTAEPAVRRTVLDISRVDFADSSALHTLLAAQRAHRAAGREMVLAGPLSASLHRLFTVTGTDAFFTFTDSSSFPPSDARDGHGRHDGERPDGERPDGEHTAR